MEEMNRQRKWISVVSELDSGMEGIEQLHELDMQKSVQDSYVVFRLISYSAQKKAE